MQEDGSETDAMTCEATPCAVTPCEAIPCGANPCDANPQTVDFIRGALLLQEKWVLMIVHSLLGGSISFNELMRRGKVNTTTLSQRLNLLVRAGVLVKTIHSTMPPRTSYELTEAGLALGPLLEAIAEWSGKYLSNLPEPSECPGAELSSQECPSLECPGEEAC